MKLRRLIVAAALAAALALAAGCEGDFWTSNRCVLLDRNHTFDRVTILYGNTNVVYDVIAWKDYEQSDVVQVWVKDETCPNGTRVVLSHYSRMVLENTNPKYRPKY